MATLSVNVNSYVTLEEADTFVENNYMSMSAEYVKWNELTDNDKIVALTSSATALNNLRYKGQKKIKGQLLAFPRVYRLGVGFGIGYIPYVSQYVDSSLYEGVSSSDCGYTSAKEAQIVNAVAGVAVDADLISDVRQRTVQAIKSESIGKVSKSYDIDSPRTKNIMRGIYDYDRVTYILNGWLTDSVFSL